MTLWTCPNCLSVMPSYEKEDHARYHTKLHYRWSWMAGRWLLVGLRRNPTDPPRELSMPLLWRHDPHAALTKGRAGICALGDTLHVALKPESCE